VALRSEDEHDALPELSSLEDHWASTEVQAGSLDALAALASELTGMAMAAVTISEGGRQGVVGAKGLPVGAIQRENPFCAVLLETPDQPLVIPDTLADPRFSTVPVVTDQPHIRSYVGVALVTGDGIPLGAICVMDSQLRQLSDRQLTGLHSLSQLATELLQAQRTATLSATSNAALRRAQAAQRKTRDEFQTVFDHATLGMSLLDEHGTYLRVNSAFALMLDLPADEIIGQSFAKFTANDTEDDARVVRDLIERNGGSSIREKLYQRADGTTFPALVTTSAVRPSEGDDWLLLSQIESLAERRTAESSLLEVQSAIDGIITINGAGRVASWNLGAERLLGYPASSMLGQTLDGILADDLRLFPYRSGVDEDDRESPLLSGTTEVRAVRADGQHLLVELTVSRWEQDGSSRYTAVLRDITARRRTQALLDLVAQAARAANEAQSLAEAAPAVIGAFCSFLGWTAGRAWSGQEARASWYVARHRHPTDQPCALEHLAAIGSRPDPTDLPFDHLTRVTPDHKNLIAGDIEGALVTCDIESAVAVPVLAGADTGGVLAMYLPAGAGPPDPESIAALEQVGVVLGRLLERERTAAITRHQASHDPLTDLANRRALFEAIADTQAGLAAGKPAGKHALLMLDLDRFKLVNDSLGHQAGDSMLQDVARRITECLRPGDLAARLGGDEFAILTHGHRDESSIAAYAERVLTALTGTVNIAKNVLPLHASIGVCVIVSEHGALAHDSTALLSDADAALRHAKRRGKGRVEIFDGALRNDAVQRLRDETELERAVASGQLLVHYQPLINLTTRAPLGAEALGRWQRPGRGLILPAYFIPLAEESGLIRELGRWVLRTACADAAGWDRSVPVLSGAAVSVNVSPRQLIHPGYTDDVDAALSESGLPANRLILEITETLLFDENDSAIPMLTDLRSKGVRIALDDFGTGYSSLSYMQRLIVDILKIDKSFIDPIQGPGDGTALAEVVLKLAQALQLRSVAEGIEDIRQITALREMGCDWAQGHGLSVPVPIADLAAACAAATEAVLGAGNRRSAAAQDNRSRRMTF